MVNYEILGKVENLLAEYAPDNLATQENVQEALALLSEEYTKEPESYGDWLAKAYVLANKPQEAIKICDERLKKEDPKKTIIGRWYYFWKAAAFAELKKVDELCEQLSLGLEIDNDIRKATLGQKEFFPYLENAKLQKAIGLPPKPTLSEEIQTLAELIISGKYLKAYELTLTLEKNSDQASVIDGALKALEAIINDIKEHGIATLKQKWGGGKYSLEDFERAFGHYQKKKKQMGFKQSPLTDFFFWQRE